MHLLTIFEGSFVIFEVYTVALCVSMQQTRPHAAPCTFRLYLKGLHVASVVFDVYKVAPRDPMRLRASLDFI